MCKDPVSPAASCFILFAAWAVVSMLVCCALDSLLELCSTFHEVQLLTCINTLSLYFVIKLMNLSNPNLSNPKIQEMTTAVRVQLGANHRADTSNAFKAALDPLSLGKSSRIPENSQKGPGLLLCGLQIKGQERFHQVQSA